MPGLDEVAKIALALPEVTEEPVFGNRSWKVRKKLFAWERPLRQKEIEQLGGLESEGGAPTGEILGLRVPDEETKTALLESEPEIYFTTPHFDGYPSVLVRLERIPRKDLEEGLVEAWLCRAPKRIAKAWLAAREG